MLLFFSRQANVSSVLPVRPQPKLEAEPKKFKSEESTSGIPSSSSDRVETNEINVKSNDADSKVVEEEHKETVSSVASNSDKMIVDEVSIGQTKAIDAQPAETKEIDKEEEEEEDIGEVFIVSKRFLPFHLLASPSQN